MSRCLPDKKLGKSYLGRRNIMCRDRIVKEYEVFTENDSFDLAGAEWEVIGRKATYVLYHIIIFCLDFLCSLPNA